MLLLVNMVDIASNLEGGYGFGEMWDNITPNDMYEYCLAPQHESRGLVAAIQCRDQTNKEMERQVKKYGRDALAPPLHAHDGLDKTSVDNEIFSRAIVLKGKGEKKDSKKQKEPTYRLRQHLFKGKKLSGLQVKDNGVHESTRAPAVSL